jgi:hypothetical protein
MYCGVCEMNTEHVRGTCKICLDAYKASQIIKQLDNIRTSEGQDDRCYNEDEQ